MNREERARIGPDRLEAYPTSPRQRPASRQQVRAAGCGGVHQVVGVSVGEAGHLLHEFALRFIRPIARALPFSRNAPFSTGTLRAATRAALSAVCVTPLSLGPKRVVRTRRSVQAEEGRVRLEEDYQRIPLSIVGVDEVDQFGRRELRGAGGEDVDLGPWERRPSRPQGSSPTPRGAAVARVAVETAGSTERMTSSYWSGAVRPPRLCDCGLAFVAGRPAARIDRQDHLVAAPGAVPGVQNGPTSPDRRVLIGHGLQTIAASERGGADLGPCARAALPRGHCSGQTGSKSAPTARRKRA